MFFLIFVTDICNSFLDVPREHRQYDFWLIVKVQALTFKKNWPWSSGTDSTITSKRYSHVSFLDRYSKKMHENYNLPREIAASFDLIEGETSSDQ